jgi:hypothetical protein
MGEGGPRFEGEGHFGPDNLVQSPEQQFRTSLREEVYRVLTYSEDPLAIEVAEKILQKLEIKDRVDDLILHKDDPRDYQPWKMLGLFIVVDTYSRIDWKDKQSGLEVHKGDHVLDIHLPTITNPEDRTLANVTASMCLIADYIATQHMDPKYIMGVTFEKLARVSRRQGFAIVEPQVPPDIQRGVQRVYERFTDMGINQERMGKILLCFQPTDQFMARYGYSKHLESVSKT